MKYTVILDLSIEAENEEEAIRKFKKDTETMEHNVFEVTEEKE